MTERDETEETAATASGAPRPVERPIPGALGGSIEALLGDIRRRAQFDGAPAESRWRRRGWRWRPQHRLVVAAGLVGVLALALLVVPAAFDNGGSPALVPPRRAVATRATVASGAATNAFAGLPQAWRSSCRQAPALDPLAVESFVCRGDGGAVQVEVRSYRSRTALLARFAAESRGVVRTRGAARCARGRIEQRAWALPARPTLPVGRYVCRRDQLGAVLAWTDMARRRLVRAVRADGNLAALFAWWQRVPRL